MIEAGAASFAGAIPTILKVNSANSLAQLKDQAVTGSVGDALRLGCSAIGFTIYPGSDDQFGMMEEIRELAEEAKAVGLAVVIWSYPRGGKLSKDGETAIDITRLCRAHGGAARRAHHQGQAADGFHRAARGEEGLSRSRRSTSRRSRRASPMSCSRASTAGASSCSRAARPRTRRACSTRSAQIRDGGGNGSIIGRNTFQRPREDALGLLDSDHQDL